MSEAIIGMVGVIVGGGVTTTGTVWAQRLQRKASIAAERRAREIAASTTALTALSQLMTLPDKPDPGTGPAGDPPQQGDTRPELMLIFGIAAQDLGNAELRNRLDEVHRILELHKGAAYYSGRTERQIRLIACEHALRCLGAFRRGGPLPERPEQYTELLNSIATWLDAGTSR